MAAIGCRAGRLSINPVVCGESNTTSPACAISAGTSGAIAGGGVQLFQSQLAAWSVEVGGEMLSATVSHSDLCIGRILSGYGLACPMVARPQIASCRSRNRSHLCGGMVRNWGVLRHMLLSNNSGHFAQQPPIQRPRICTWGKRTSSERQTCQLSDYLRLRPVTDELQGLVAQPLGQARR